MLDKVMSELINNPTNNELSKLLTRITMGISTAGYNEDNHTRLIALLDQTRYLFYITRTDMTKDNLYKLGILEGIERV